MAPNKQTINAGSSPTTQHPDYVAAAKIWARVRDCVAGEAVIKSKEENYLPRPQGMSGAYADAYDSYLERAHFPLICAYALQGALGVIVTKLPEFNLPKELEYLTEEATKDGRSLKQLFLDIIVELMQTGRVPLVVDVVPENNEFKFVQYKAEDFINWKTSTVTNKSEDNLILGVLTESVPDGEDIFSHDTVDLQRVLLLDEGGKYASKIFGPDGKGESTEYAEFNVTPTYMGKTLDAIPLVIAGSINNSYEIQPVPLISVANCSIQIYRKEADLANSEFLSCNPTLVISGISNDGELPNVVGSSVLIALPDSQARAYYTETDVAALDHVHKHIESLYDEAIRHGASILDSRKGIEAAEALRIRQATQSASIYSIYRSAMEAMISGLEVMCEWAGLDKSKITVDATSSLTFNVPDSFVIKEIVEGFGAGVMPLTVVHSYMIQTGLLEETVSYEEYVASLKEQNAALDGIIVDRRQQVPNMVGGADREWTMSNNADTMDIEDPDALLTKSAKKKDTNKAPKNVKPKLKKPAKKAKK